MSKIFKEITNGRGERVLENPAVQVLGAIFRKMNLDQNTIGAVSERLQNEKEKKDNIVKIIVAVVIIYLICVESTHDALIKYQAMTFGFNITLFCIRSKPSFSSGQTPAYSSWLCF